MVGGRPWDRPAIAAESAEWTPNAARNGANVSDENALSVWRAGPWKPWPALLKLAGTAGVGAGWGAGSGSGRLGNRGAACTGAVGVVTETCCGATEVVTCRMTTGAAAGAVGATTTGTLTAGCAAGAVGVVTTTGAGFGPPPACVPPPDVPVRPVVTGATTSVTVFRVLARPLTTPVVTEETVVVRAETVSVTPDTVLDKVLPRTPSRPPRRPPLSVPDSELSDGAVSCGFSAAAAVPALIAELNSQASAARPAPTARRSATRRSPRPKPGVTREPATETSTFDRMADRPYPSYM